MAIGGAQTYSLSEVRGGEISMLKASANAIAAHTGALGALLAADGMSGPPKLFEGGRGMLAAFGFEPSEELRRTLIGPSDYWSIVDISIKPFPAIATSQGALSATLELAREHKLKAEDVASVEVRFADLPITRDHLADADRRDPRTRETADHSINFLVAAALQDGELGPAQFRDERWLRPDTRELMRRVSMLADPGLNAHAVTEYPATVTVTTRGGQMLHREMLKVPGSPTNPLSDEQLCQKLRRFAGTTFSTSRLDEIEQRLLNLDQEADMAEIGALLRGEDQGR
jgi:2-methylcitrate dehydratase